MCISLFSQKKMNFSYSTREKKPSRGASLRDAVHGLLQGRAGAPTHLADSALSTVILLPGTGMGTPGTVGEVPTAGTALRVKPDAADGLEFQAGAHGWLHSEWSESSQLVPSGSSRASGLTLSAVTAVGTSPTVPGVPMAATGSRSTVAKAESAR